MEKLTGLMRSYMLAAGEWTEVLMNVLSLLVIVGGTILSLVKSMQAGRSYANKHLRHTQFRRMFGGWLLVALEFQLAADIVGTIISPTNEQLIRLGSIALIRTFLNYFLNKELDGQAETSLLAKPGEQEKTQA